MDQKGNQESQRQVGFKTNLGRLECNQFMNAGRTDEYCNQKKRQENWNLFEDKEEVADPPEKELSFFNADLKEIENQQLFANESGSNKKTVKD